MRPGLSTIQIVGASLVATHLASALSPRTKIDDSYDFVIVGGGQAGLVLGARLSEDKNHTVLVLESGGDGDEFRKRINTPAYSYFDSLWTTPLNWDFYTVAQPNADDREINWPRGKVLGGSSAINGLYMTRPGEDEINAWKDMVKDMDGADNWSWDSFYAAMKKSETFTPPTDDVVDEAGIVWNAKNHGTDGPIHTTYPDYTFPEVGDWLKSLQSIGIDISDKMYGGETWGADVSTSCINPSNWTRSYSRSGYLDPLPERDNYDVLANAHVTRLIFEDSKSSDKKTASAVEYTTDKGSTKLKVKVNKEVILASGSIGSPAVLLYSGVGPKDVLSAAGVDLVSELPGVGQHLQDHFSATVKWSTNVDTAGSIFYDGGKDKNNPKFLTYIDSAVAYVNSTAIYGAKVDEFESKFLASIDRYAPNTTYDDGVISGYKAICNTTASKIFSGPTGQIELLFMNSDGNGDIGITAALQHPFSHGRIYINSSDPMDYPVIDPNYLNNPADYEILLEGIKMARKVGETSPMSKSLTNETSPGTTVQSDEDWIEWLRKNAGTEFHPSSSCAMLPEKQGGVVDAKLRVYGLANVRVADASVIPISLSTHLMSSTYGVAELASDIIREYHNAASEPKPAFSSSSSSGSTPVSSPIAVKKSGTPESNGSAAGYGGAALSLVWSSLLLPFVHVIGYGVFA
ncbi:Glucose-methanol-choline oxidoreductase [Penicillium coprophilum]|uniref:Glucose-methanol-choline oxidoreductase n=1 Tax=Penicillium coprophilum TaxID=36646 RepID=UPI00239C0B48|nr:Glucose-methanol-choline oxidoreductase [Penicillium coprophilum]KAJ5164927.1 Glucose-methanol-choline oxidoreductase [Penicillium coprophilum]